jgi:hypothetical protein
VTVLWLGVWCGQHVVQLPLPAMATPASRWWPQVDLARWMKGDQGVIMHRRWKLRLGRELTHTKRVLLLLLDTSRVEGGTSWLLHGRSWSQPRQAGGGAEGGKVVVSQTGSMDGGIAVAPARPHGEAAVERSWREARWLRGVECLHPGMLVACGGTAAAAMRCSSDRRWCPCGRLQCGVFAQRRRTRRPSLRPRRKGGAAAQRWRCRGRRALARLPRGGEQRGEEGVAMANGETLGRAAAVAVL